MMQLWRGLGLAGKIVVGVVAAVVVGVALYAAYRFVDAPRRAKEAEIANRTQTAYTDSARAAIDVIVAATERDDKTQKEITDEVARIQQLPEADRYLASVTLLCRMPEYASDARCAALRRTGSEGVEKRDQRR